MDYGWLQINHRGGMQQDIPLRDEVTFGRAPDNDVVLNESTVSPYHAKLVCDSTGCWIVDLTSANGTYVDGARLFSQQPQMLTEGTVVQIGNTRIIAYPAEVAASDAEQPDPNISTAPTLAAPVVAAPPPITPTETFVNPFMATTPPVYSGPPSTPVTPGGGSASASSASANLTLTTTDLAAHAGGTAFSSIYVVNRSSIVNRIELVVDGVPPSWVTIKPNTLSLFPGGQGEAQVQISPPRDPNSRAGAHSFEVIARSDQFPNERTAVAGSLTILPYSEFALDINPQQQTGRVQGTYEVEISNKSNSEHTFEFEGREAENAMTFRFLPPTLKVGPGEVATVRTRTRLVATHWVGRPKIYPFTINVAPADQSASPQQVSGRLVHRPPISPQMLMFLLPLMILTCGGLAALWQYSKPKITAALSSTATPTVPVVTITPTFFVTDTTTPLETVVAIATEPVQSPPPEPTLVVPPVIVPEQPTTAVQQPLPVASAAPAAPTAAPSATAQPTPTVFIQPTSTTAPTATPEPTATTQPTPTLFVPTTMIVNTTVPLPTSTPGPTATPTITLTPIPLTISASATNIEPSSRDCTKTFTFNGTISLNGPGLVRYQWERSDGSSAELQEINFTSGGTQNVYHTWNVTTPSSGWALLRVLEPKPATSQQATYTLSCDKQRIAYVYTTDTRSRDAFNQFFFEKEFVIDLVPQSAVSTHANAASWAYIVVGNDTSWSASGADTQRILSLGKPVLSIGAGGQSFFLAVNPGNSGRQSTGKDIRPFNKQDTSIWEGINTGADVPLYTTSTPMVEIYNPQAKKGLIRVGQDLASTDHYPIIAQESNGQCYKLWGFNGIPSTMTDQGKQLFTNLFFKSACPPAISLIKLSVTDVYCSGSLEPTPPQSNGDEIYFRLRGDTTNGNSTFADTTTQRGVVGGVTFAPSMTTPLEFSDPGSSFQISVEGIEQDTSPEFNDGDNRLSGSPVSFTREDLFNMFGTTTTREFTLIGQNGRGSYRVTVSIIVE